MSFYYAGVGGRETPAHVLNLMTRIAQGLAKVGGILRSGGARGADTAFEAGAGSAKEIFLPYPGFQGNPSRLHGEPTPEAIALARAAHPYFDRMRPDSFAYQAHARNAHQVMGQDCRTPAAFLVCWTPDGAEDAASSHSVEATGGTRTAIVIAEQQGVPVFNLARPDALHRLQTYVKTKVLLEREPWHYDAAAMDQLKVQKNQKKAYGRRANSSGLSPS